MFTFDWLAKRADLSPGKTALVDTATGRRFSYLQFHERASRLAEFLQAEWGIRPGERVAILAPNCTDYFEVLYGCAKVGAILVCLNWRLAVPELEAILRDSTPRALFYDAQLAAAAGALLQGSGAGPSPLQHLACLGESAPDGTWAYERALAQASGRPVVMPPRRLDEVWHILYTAGTTGRPKGVLQTFGMVLYNALNIGLGIDLTSQDVSLNLLPCFHTGGLNMYANPTFHVGGTAIIQRAFDPAESLRLLSAEATAFFGVAANYLFMSQHPDFERTDLSRVRSWASGGSALPTSVLEAYARRGITIQQGFGMTETGPTVFLVDKEHALSKAGSVGKPQMHVQVRIVDGTGRDLPANQPGELLIRGPGVTPGYWQLPDVTAKAIEDGWLHSGDVARADDEGYYTIVDRIKDMFISGGENVYPAEIENVIFQMPEVAEVAVISVPDPRWQEAGKAVVVLRPGASLSEQEVIAFCRARLAGYKTPKSVAFVERLPRNPAGKVLKVEVRGWFVQQGGGQEAAAQPGTRPEGMLGRPMIATPSVGQSAEVRRVFVQSDFDRFAAISGDDNPIHVDPAFSARTKFGRTVAHGMFLYSVVCGVVSTRVPGPGTRQLEQELMFPNPTYTGEEVTARIEVTEVDAGAGTASLTTVILRADGKPGLEGRTRVRLPGVPGMETRPTKEGPGTEAGLTAGEGFKGLTLGQRAETRRVFSARDLAEYADLAGDPNPLLTDESFARRQGLDGLLVPGGLLGGMISFQLGTRLPGQGTNYLKQRLEFPAPACAGQELVAAVEVVRLRPEKQLVNLSTTVCNRSGTIVCRGEALVLASDVGV